MSPSELIGKAAPALTLPSATELSYTFDPATIQKPVALFFYPAAGTYGCTKEVCSFRDALSKDLYKRSDCQVIGISGDSVTKQKAFVEAQELTYPVLCDVDGEARRLYHLGKGLLGLTEARTTFIIHKGVIQGVYDSVLNYNAHEKFVSKWLEANAAGGATDRLVDLRVHPGSFTRYDI